MTSIFSSVGQWCLPAKLFSPSPQLATDRLDSDQRQGVRQDGSQPALADERWTFSEPDMNFTLVPTSWPLDSAHNGGDGAGKESAHYRVQRRSSGWQIVYHFIIWVIFIGGNRWGDTSDKRDSGSSGGCHRGEQVFQSRIYPLNISQVPQPTCWLSKAYLNIYDWILKS